MMIARNSNATEISPDSRNPISGVIASARDVVTDLVELSELQVELTKIDMKQFVSQSILSLGGALLASMMMLAFFFLGMLGFSDLVATEFNFDVNVTRLSIGLIGSGLAFSMLVVCIFRLRNGLNSFATSRDQLAQNLDWLKEIIRRS